MSGADLTLTFLGTGGAIPPANMTHGSFCLRHTHGLMIFDCGEGMQFALRKYKVPIRKELVIAISHLHSDHFLGLPGLLASFQLQDRTEPITIIGPEYMKTFVENLLRFTLIRITYPLKVIELKPGASFNSKGYTLTAHKAIHEAYALSYVWKEDDHPGHMLEDKLNELGIPKGPLWGKLQRGQTIEFNGQQVTPEMVQQPPVAGRCLAYTGDTAVNPQFITKIPQPCDVLVHEGTYASIDTQLAEERKHSTWEGAAQMAKLANAQQLIITHISSRLVNMKDEHEAILSIFKDTLIAKKGLQVVIPFKRTETSQS